MGASPLTVRPVDDHDRAWVLDMVREWGADYVVCRGRKIYPAQLPGFCALSSSGDQVGLATYESKNGECQLVTLHALERRCGIGTALLVAVREAAAAAGCLRLWLTTTNDNLDALRFYQRRGFRLVAVHRDLHELARQLKPSIPLVGEYGIPIREEIEMEMRFDSSEA